MEKSQNPKLGPATDFITIDPTKCVKLYTKNKDENFVTFSDIFAKTVKTYPNRSAMMYQDEATGQWISITYSEYKRRAEHIAKAFLKLGLEKKGRVAVIAANSAEWFLAKMATILAGAQIVGIYNTNSAEACHFILDKCRANIVIVDDDIQLEKILKFKSKLPHVKAIIKTLQSKTGTNCEGVLKWSELEAMDVEGFDEIYEKLNKEVTANSCCCLVFTSGTTGNPKGAMLSHDNVIGGANKFINKFNLMPENNEVVVSYLPLSHIAGSLLDFFVMTTLAGTVYFADKNALKRTLITTLLVARPTIFFGVPRVYEKIQEKIQNQFENSSGLKKLIISWLQSSALTFHRSRFNGKAEHWFLSVGFTKFMLNKIKAKIGLNRCKGYFTGAAPFNPDTTNFFLSLDIVISDLYGMTECGIIAGASVDEMKLESVGKMLPNIEGKISNPDENGIGEICIRGRNLFMGYTGELEKTKEVIDDEHWLHSGDLGYFDKDGYLFLTGRIKELIITAGGENIPFVNIENAVKAECPAISNAFLIGDKRKFLTMLITLKTQVDANGTPLDELADETVHELQNLGLNHTLLSQVIKSGPDARILKLVQDAINRANSKAISNAQKVQKFIILPNDFSLHTGELGPTMKLKRGFVLDKYKKEIDVFYI